MVRTKLKRKLLDRLLADVSLFDLDILSALPAAKSGAELSRRLNLSPSKISKTVKHVERVVGFDIFSRTKTGMFLTPEGKRFTEMVREVFVVLGSFHPKEEAFSKDIVKVFSIAAPSYVANGVLSQFSFTDASGSSRSSRFRIINAAGDDLVSLGLSGAFEVAFHLGPRNWPKSWFSKPIGNLRQGLFAKKGHPILGKSASTEDVRFYPFIVPVSWGAQGFRYGEDLCPLSIFERNLGDEVPTVDLGFERASHSQQLIFGPVIAAERFVKSNQLQEVRVADWPVVSQTLFLTVHSDQVPQGLFKALFEFSKRVTF